MFEALPSIQITTVTKAALVDLDATSVVILVLFLVLFFILDKLLHQPMLNMFEERHGLTDGAKEEARQAVSDAEKKFESYKSRLADSRRDALAQQQKLRDEGLAQEREILDEVRMQADKQIEEGISDLQSQAASIEQELQEAASSLGERISTLLLGGAGK
jgi:F0F1-type ATP synthase membrane subunit b/b'